MQVDAREIAALTQEGEAYRAAGMLDRVELVNDQLKQRGAALIEVPKADAATRQKRTSTQAATRTKRAVS